MVFLGKHLQKYAKIPWYRASETIWQANKSPMIWLLNYFTTQIPTVVTWLFWPSKIWTISHFLLSFEYWACTVFGSPLWKIWITDNLKNEHVFMLGCYSNPTSIAKMRFVTLCVLSKCFLISRHSLPQILQLKTFLSGAALATSSLDFLLSIS